MFLSLLIWYFSMIYDLFYINAFLLSHYFRYLRTCISKGDLPYYEFIPEDQNYAYLIHVIIFLEYLMLGTNRPQLVNRSVHKTLLFVVFTLVQRRFVKNFLWLIFINLILLGIKDGIDIHVYNNVNKCLKLVNLFTI